MGHLIFVGLGLSRPQDMSVRAQQVLRECDEVFAEFYTSRLIDATMEDLEEFIGKKVAVLRRSEVEEGDAIIEAARRGTVAFMVAGDPMSATTHVDLRLRAIEEGINTELVFGVSIFTAAAGPSVSNLTSSAARSQFPSQNRVICRHRPMRTYWKTARGAFTPSCFWISGKRRADT